MQVLLIALAAGLAFVVAYHTYGRWLGKKVFRLSASAVCPSVAHADGQDYVPTSKGVVFGHHFTSIAGTGPIVGPAIAVMWGWLPALLWVVFGSIFIGAVHDFGALVVSLRNQGQTVGEVAGRVVNKRVRLLFLLVLFLALTIVLAIFGLVIAAVFKQYPAAIFPCLVQIPLAVGIGVWLHRKGVHLLLPSLIALAVMYLTVIYGNASIIGDFNTMLGGDPADPTRNGWPTMVWVIVLLVYSYMASVLPVWTLLQPRDYINSLQLISALGLIVVGLGVAAFAGGAPPVEGAARQPLELVAPMVRWDPADAPLIFPFLFITIACGAISGFHCLVSSGTSSKQLKTETDAQFVGFGSMLTEGFLATLVILACCAGLGLGTSLNFSAVFPDEAKSDLYRLPNGEQASLVISDGIDGKQVELVRNDGDVESSLSRVPHVTGQATLIDEGGVWIGSVDALWEYADAASAEGYWILWNESTGEIEYAVPPPELKGEAALVSATAWNTRYASWTSANGLGAKVGAFVDGAANFLKAMGIPAHIAIALMGVLVASFAGTTLDTACRLQRYVVQELARCLLPPTLVERGLPGCMACGYDLRGNVSGVCPECGTLIIDETQEPLAPAARQGLQPASTPASRQGLELQGGHPISLNPLTWLANKHGATVFAVTVAAAMAAMPLPGSAWSWANAGKGGLILWPMFGATNQLLGGLAFMVITFYLWRRGKAVWFIALPLVFMLVMPAWAMVWLIFIGDGSKAGWAFSESPNWVLIAIALATLALEAWMLVEAALLVPKVRGVVEGDTP
ncbi:MAG: carbon starvation CstA family protein [Planctomycetota bacterium]